MRESARNMRVCGVMHMQKRAEENGLFVFPSENKEGLASRLARIVQHVPGERAHRPRRHLGCVACTEAAGCALDYWCVSRRSTTGDGTAN